MLAYVRFETVRTLRNPAFLFLVTVAPVALYLLGVRGISAGDLIGGLPASLWYLGSSVAFGAMGAAIMGSGARLAAERASGWSRQLRVTPLTETGWLAGRVISSLLAVIPVVIFVAVVAIFVGGVELSAGRWLALAASVVLGSIPVALIGLIVGMAFRAEAAQAAQAIAFVALAFLGGVFAQAEDPPDVLRGVVQGSPSYHLVVLARIAVGGEGSAAVSIAALAAMTAVLVVVVALLRRRSA